jgi:hypothetical protein
MKFRLDENLGSRTAGLIAQSGRLWVVEAGRIRVYEEAGSLEADSEADGSGVEHR